MWIRKKELRALSEAVRKAIDGQDVDLRDNKEGELSILKNDIHTLIHIEKEQKEYEKKEKEVLAKYLADISHQIKTPLTSTMLLANLIPDAPKEKQQIFLMQMKKEFAHMEWLVSTILKMARLDSKAVEFHMEHVQLSALMDSAITPLNILLDIRDQKVEALHDMELFCDKRWTAEALSNLIKNASENSPLGSRITIDGGRNPIFSFISVTDCGVGIPKEKLRTLFTRFYNSQSENGYGIGLPLALSIMKAQNGDIDVTQEPGQTGVTFTMKFYK